MKNLIKRNSNDKPYYRYIITQGCKSRRTRIANHDNIGNFRGFFATESIIVTEDAAKIANNIIANELLFRCTL